MGLTISARVFCKRLSMALLEGSVVRDWFAVKVSRTTFFSLLLRTYLTRMLTSKEVADCSLMFKDSREPVRI